jgi:hypothetical protein
MSETQHHPFFLKVIHTLKPLLRTHPPLAVMHTDDMADWMSWYWNRGTMSYVIDEEEEPLGVCLIRMFRHLEQFMDPNAHSPCGEFCLIELLVSRDPITTGVLCDALVQRWGPQKIMMWERGKRTENGSPRMFRWDQFIKLARRISYGITENA